MPSHLPKPSSCGYSDSACESRTFYQIGSEIAQRFEARFSKCLRYLQVAPTVDSTVCLAEYSIHATKGCSNWTWDDQSTGYPG